MALLRIKLSNRIILYPCSRPKSGGGEGRGKTCLRLSPCRFCRNFWIMSSHLASSIIYSWKYSKLRIRISHLWSLQINFSFNFCEMKYTKQTSEHVKTNMIRITIINILSLKLPHYYKTDWCSQNISTYANLHLVADRERKRVNKISCRATGRCRWWIDRSIMSDFRALRCRNDKNEKDREKERERERA